jgi:hypothetical protein
MADLTTAAGILAELVALDGDYPMLVSMPRIPGRATYKARAAAAWAAARAYKPQEAVAEVIEYCALGIQSTKRVKT